MGVRDERLVWETSIEALPSWFTHGEMGAAGKASRSAWKLPATAAGHALLELCQSSQC